MRNGTVASGCLLTFSIWLLAGLTMLGPIMGDCVAGFGHTCPTDHDRSMSLLRIALVALAINVALIWLLLYLQKRRG